MDSTANILPGCPSGGVSILYKKSLGHYVKNINVSSSRICGVTIQTSVNHKILVLCVYLPCDNFSSVHVTEEYMATMDAIECAMEENNCNACIMCGDFNSSFKQDNDQSRYLCQ